MAIIFMLSSCTADAYYGVRSPGYGYYDQDTTVMVPDIQRGYMFMVDITEDFIISGRSPWRSK
jgi:hypothetical protein